jgi:hypothetical protein
LPLTETARLVKKAEEQRDQQHRLKPNLRLKTKAEILGFIHDQGIVSVLGGNELPSFISAVLGKPWKPSAKGFKGWLDWWSLKVSGERLPKLSGEIERMDEIVATRIFRKSKTFVSKRLWLLIDPIVKHQSEHQKFSPLESKLLEKIRSEGSIRTDRLRQTLGLEAKDTTSQFHRALTNLESRALIVGSEDPHPEQHLHANIWQTWENRTDGKKRRSEVSYQEAVARLLEETIRVCVVVRDDQIRKWFRWSSDTELAKDELVGSKRLLRIGEYLIPAGLMSA